MSDLDTIRLERRNDAVGFLNGVVRVMLLSPLHVLRGRRVVCLGILVALPPILVLILRGFGQAEALGITAFKELVFGFYLTAIFPLATLFLGAAAVGDDIDDGTVLYLRLRPVPRAAIVTGRFLAAAFSSVVLFVPSLALLYSIQVGGIGLDSMGRYLRILQGASMAAVFASLGYCALFLLLGLLVRRAVIYGIIFVMVQNALMFVPGPVSWLSLNLHLGTVLDEYSAANDAMSDILMRLDDVGFAPSFGQAMGSVLGATALIVLAAGWLFASREYLEKPGD